MPRSVRDLIEPLWYTGTATMLPTTVVARATYPAATEKASGDESKPIDTYPDHLYVIPEGKPKAGRFPVDTSKSSWEQMVLTIELELSETLVGWYRNASSGRHALAIPYEFGDKSLLMHPDFLFFHQDGDDIVLDLIDPHRHDANDAAPKWAALARYAAEHGEGLRQVLARDPQRAGPPTCPRPAQGRHRREGHRGHEQGPHGGAVRCGRHEFLKDLLEVNDRQRLTLTCCRRG
ncbi:hypothetical protein BH20ACT6_BH20ACT6_22750 [soil metagenome]